MVTPLTAFHFARAFLAASASESCCDQSLVHKQACHLWRPLRPLISLIRSGGWEGYVHEHPCLVMSVRRTALVGDGGDRGRPLGFGVSGDFPDAHSLRSLQEVLPTVSSRPSYYPPQSLLGLLGVLFPSCSSPLFPGFASQLSSLGPDIFVPPP